MAGNYGGILGKSATDLGSDRQKLGKPAKGRVNIDAYQQGSQIVVEVSDDGRGIDVDRIRKKAQDSGLVPEEEMQRMTDKEALNLIFLPGFSTVDIATEPCCDT